MEKSENQPHPPEENGKSENSKLSPKENGKIWEPA
jgi:hypothetical protein